MTIFYTRCGPVAFRRHPGQLRCAVTNCDRVVATLVEEFTSLPRHLSNRRISCMDRASLGSVHPPRRLRCRRLAVSAPGSVDDPGYVTREPSTSSPPVSGDFLRRGVASLDEDDSRDSRELLSVPVVEQHPLHQHGSTKRSSGPAALTARLIGSLHKHSMTSSYVAVTSKSKAEKVAEAAVLATYLTSQQDQL